MAGLGVVVALPGEARCLAGRPVPAGKRLSLTQGVTVQLSGLGMARARRAALSLVHSGAGALLSFGTAAGLDPALAPGALLLPRRVIAAGGQTWSVDERWHQRCEECLQNLLEVETRPLAEARAVMDSAAVKYRLFARTQAAAADMESAAVMEVAAAARRPALVLRAVADPANLALPPSAVAAVDEDGRLRLFGLLRSILSTPGDIAGIVRVRRGFNAARSALTQATRTLGPTLLAPEST